MSYCPRPKKTAKTNWQTPAVKKVNPPQQRTEACGPSQSVIDGGTGEGSTTIIYVPTEGPAGPQGPAGTNGKDGLGFFWRGTWGTGASYEEQDNTSDTKRLSDVVFNEGESFICIQDHVADAMNEPHNEDFVGPTNWPDYWALMVRKGADGSGGGEEATIFDNIMDWIDNASIGDLIAAGLGVAGLIYAGSEILDSMTEDGTGDGQADQRYTGSPGLVGPFTSPDIKEVLTSLCTYADIAFDVTALPDAPCEFTIGNLTAVRTIIEQLSLAYSFDMVDTGGMLKFTPRSATPAVTLTEADLGFTDSDTPTAPYEAKRFQGIDLPRSVTVKYYSKELDYNTFTQTSQIFTYVDGQDVSLDVPLTIPDAQAKLVAELNAINSHLERQAYAFTTSYKHIDLEPGDVVSAPFGLARITKISETNEGLIQMEAVDAGGELALEGSDLDITIPPPSSNIPLEIGYSQAWFLDPNAVNDQDKNVRMYVAIHGFDKPGWPGAQVYASDNGGANYTLVGSTTSAAVTGIVSVATPAADWHVWDETTTISVQLKTGALSSKSELDVLNGNNWCLLGQEIIGFKNAVLTGPKTYTLSGLLRGRQGTEQFIPIHAANELFILLDSALVKIDWNDADRSSLKKYKVVTVGSSLDKVDGLDVQMYSYNTLMWPVYNAKLLQVGADWQISYKERVRFDNQLKDFSTTNHDTDWGGYGIQILNSAGTAVVKDYTTTSEMWTYTEAMQIADFGSAQSTLKVKVAQLSTKWGAGYPVSLNS